MLASRMWESAGRNSETGRGISSGTSEVACGKQGMEAGGGPE